MDEFVIVGDVLKEYKGKDLTVIVPDGIKHIDSCAFAKCGMRKVVLPEGLESIDNAAFIGCDRLDYIRLPSSTKSTGKRAFFGCSKLKHVFISSDVDIEEQAFEGCEMLADENGFIIINNELFECIKGGDLVVPEGVRRIRGHAFEWISDKITSIKFPKTLEKIDSNAFALWEKCELYITAKTTDIADDAFTRIKPVICAPAFSTAHKYAKKHGMAFVSTGRELSEKIRADISDKIEAKHQKKQSRIHEKRVAEYGMKVERIDKCHAAIYIDKELPAPFNMPFFVEDSFIDYNVVTDYITDIPEKIDSGEGKLLIVIAQSKCGKTHLLNLINESLKSIYPDKKILFEDAEPLLAEIRERIAEDSGNPIKRVRESDILILDNCSNTGDDLEMNRKILNVCAHAMVKDKGGACVYAFSNEKLESIDEIDSLLKDISDEPYEGFLYFLADTDEITNQYYAVKYAEKNGYSIDEAQLNRISEEASSLEEVRAMIAEYNKQE